MHLYKHTKVSCNKTTLTWKPIKLPWTFSVCIIFIYTSSQNLYYKSFFFFCVLPHLVQEQKKILPELNSNWCRSCFLILHLPKSHLQQWPLHLLTPTMLRKKANWVFFCFVFCLFACFHVHFLFPQLTKERIPWTNILLHSKLCPHLLRLCSQGRSWASHPMPVLQRAVPAH